MSSAEDDLRSAFERLKSGNPTVIPKGSQISQNNVAREAGKDPSAFKKSRYPSLIAEIQTYVAALPSQGTVSARQTFFKNRRKNRALMERLRDVEKERDLAYSMLVGADSRILELHQRIEDLERRLPPSSVRHFPTGRE